MKKFDIAYKFTVVGIKTVEDFSKHEAADTFRQDLADAIQTELGDGSILFKMSQVVHKHDALLVENDVKDLMSRKVAGMAIVSSEAVPYFTEPETTDEDKAEVEDSSLSETGVLLD